MMTSGPDFTPSVEDFTRPPIQGQRPTAIVVDDNQAFITSLSRLLNRMSIEPLPVSDPQEAVDLARVTRPHLMCLDLLMAGRDNLRILREIREDPELSDLPVIMFSDHFDKTCHWEAMSLNCIDIIEKPIELRRLHKALQRCNLFGGTRRYLRAPFSGPVEVVCNQQTRILQGLTISERGIYVCSSDLLPRGCQARVRISLAGGRILDVGGRVIYNNLQSEDGRLSPSGMAIKFDRLTSQDVEDLTELVTNQLIGDIVAEQSEMIVRPESLPLFKP